MDVDYYTHTNEFRIGMSTIYGVRYHTVRQHYGSAVELINWCVATFSENTGQYEHNVQHAPEPGLRWYFYCEPDVSDSKIWFLNAADRDWFLLKWS